MRLRTISESRKALIAHVGASADPNSVESQIWGENDRWHMDSVFQWLMENTEDHEWLYASNREDDFVDLNDGRDFLQENGKYDIVVLHMVYSPYGEEDNWRRFHPDSPSPFKTSKHHTPQNWNRRLASTGAKYIFTFGDGEEVHGKYIGRIPGYTGPINAGNYLQVYVREQDAASSSDAG